MNLAPDAPEDAALVAQNLVDMQQLWDDWHAFASRELKGEQVVIGWPFHPANKCETNVDNGALIDFKPWELKGEQVIIAGL